MKIGSSGCVRLVITHGATLDYVRDILQFRVSFSLFPTRGHGQAIGKGLSVRAAMAEMLGDDMSL